MNFELTESAIALPSGPPEDQSVGGIVQFEGRVRNINEGLEVTSLEYEAYPALALTEGNKILMEAKDKFKIQNIFAVHRTGHLQLGDIAVLVRAESVHRKAAFLATEYAINQIKGRVPIWKREHYLDKKPEWILCAQCSSARPTL